MTHWTKEDVEKLLGGWKAPEDLKRMTDEQKEACMAMQEVVLRVLARWEKLPANKFRCGMCGNVYEKAWSDEEMHQEAVEKFGSTLAAQAKEKGDYVCSDCWEIIHPDKHPDLVAQAVLEALVNKKDK